MRISVWYRKIDHNNLSLYPHSAFTSILAHHIKLYNLYTKSSVNELYNIYREICSILDNSVKKYPCINVFNNMVTSEQAQERVCMQAFRMALPVTVTKSLFGFNLLEIGFGQIVIYVLRQFGS
jgi:hypothetical protein